MMAAGLRARLRSGDLMVGTFSLVPAPEVIELIAIAGFDFVIIDMEHGPYDLGSTRAAVVAAQGRGLPAVVRIARPEPALIGLVLDLGSDGVLVPHVSSAAVAREVIRAARFAPEGARGANPYVRAAGYGATRGWFARANRDVAVMMMIEGEEGVNATSQIARLPGVDALFLGPVDLSHALGVPGRPDHPRVVARLEEAARHAAEEGVATAVFTPEPQGVAAWRRRGVRMVACGVDTDLIRGAFTRAVTDAAAGAQSAADQPVPQVSRPFT
jgi:4-hydroxy-2-oxoheptanedioate aldolase